MSTNQEILEKLSDLECILYYRTDYTESLEGVSMEATKEIHQIIKECLVKWHNLTGCMLK